MVDIPDFQIDFSSYRNLVQQTQLTYLEGRVVQVVGLIAEAEGMGQGVGSFCKIVLDHGEDLLAEVVGFRKGNTLLMPYGSTRGIRPGSRVLVEASRPLAPVGDAFLGRVIDGMGNPLDGLGPIESDVAYSLYGHPINPLDRDPVKQPMDVGICAINTMIPLGRGQRVAIMAGSGVGKSVLMGMMTRHTAADVVIIGLIGERGREVKDFVEDILGEEGRKKSVVVAATSDVPPLVRMRGAYLSTTLAEYFRDQGKDVLLLLDSLTRYAMSSRDVGLAAGEPPTTRGYTPSFFVQVPILLERAGTVKGKGSITGIYTVLVEGDDMNDPVGDTVRSIVDGHIVLSRQIATRGQYPAIDVLASVSRVARDVSRPENLALREQAIQLLAAYREAEDMIQIGAYVDGSNPRVDLAKKMAPKIMDFLRQRVDVQVTSEEGYATLAGILAGGKGA